MKDTINVYLPKIMAASLALLAVLSVFVALKAVNEVRQYQFMGRDSLNAATISVTGEGEVFAIPNLAVFSFSVAEEAKTIPEAQKTATEKANKIIAFLKGEGVDEKDIQTSNYSVNPMYQYVEKVVTCVAYPCPPIGERVLRGYEVNQSLTVKVRETERAGELVSGVGNLGVSYISGPNFTVEDEDELRREARAEAIADAEKKAKELARDLGVRLVGVVGFSESGAPYYFRSLAEDAKFGMGGVGGGAPAPSLPEGENKIVSNVSVIYAIR